jgi:predicted  nucleic acid-binding Zn-ribbon protein
MEKDVFCGNGVMMMFKNKMFDDSDGRILYYCKTCGIDRPYNPHIYNSEAIAQTIESCSNCGSNNITAVNSAQINSYVNKILESSGINI